MRRVLRNLAGRDASGAPEPGGPQSRQALRSRRGAVNAFPRGVVSARLQRAFVTDRSGAVMAVDLDDGHVAWRAGRQLRPLAVVGDVLLALQVGPEPQLVLLDTADGRTIRSGPPLGLPRWAVPSLTDTANFTITAAPQDTSVVLRWTAQDWYAGGAAPPAEVVRAASRDAHGAVRVHIHSGVVESLPVGEPPSTGPAPAPVTPSPDPDVLE
jgi:hypothetical protein